MIAKLEYNSPEKVILYSGDTITTYKPPYICLEYNSIFSESYGIVID